MNPIVKLLSDYLESNPDIRFTQALFNLGINDFLKPRRTGHIGQEEELVFRDNYNDTDEKVLERIKKQLENK